MNHIAITLGRTQPPHCAHIHMLANALFSLKGHGQLIHFVSSSNMPVQLTSGSLNILTTQQRIDLLTAGLQEEIKQRYTDNPASVPDVFAQRIQNHSPLLSMGDFRCIPLPDFSDPAALFDTPELQSARAAAMKIVKQPSFQAHVKAQGYHHSDTYYAWAVHLKTLLDEAVGAYAQIRVTYHVCTKDNETQAYVSVIMDMMNFLEPATYDFIVNFTPPELIDGKIIHSTEIREALISGNDETDVLKSVPEKVLGMIRGMIGYQ